MTADLGIEAAIRDLLADRDGTICPSRVARELFDDWRSHMDDVRQVAARMAENGELVVTQDGEEVDIRDATGPVRLGRPDQSSS
ncbi:MAG: DUF3253 domain-containing protein [Candidatus Nanohaloarchaea archaeon]|nr:DUF3253 domain-containing protein [Candidatus Nanohaloarchaea archaeon]